MQMTAFPANLRKQQTGSLTTEKKKKKREKSWFQENSVYVVVGRIIAGIVCWETQV